MIDQANAIEVREVWRSFKTYTDKPKQLKDFTLKKRDRNKKTRDVLRGISFAVRKGEAIGLVGQNGCGKSTMLKMLSKIIYPTSGEIEVRGRVSCLIELGAGFHPDMSGRENIYINASIFGLKKSEIEKRVEDIIRFSELEEFIDNPVRTYSSGMYMRLAFAVAINVDADVLLIDEILAVGDAGFQTKCFNKLKEIKAAGTTIVIVSHSLGQIEQICDRSIWILDGRIEEEGKPRLVHPKYMDYMAQKNAERVIEEKQQTEQGQAPAEQETEADAEDSAAEETNGEENGSEQPQEEMEWLDEEAHRPKEFGTREMLITRVYLTDTEHKERNYFRTGDDANIHIAYKKNGTAAQEVVVGFHIFRKDGVDISGTNNTVDNLPPGKIKESGEIVICLEELWLAPGTYEVDIALQDVSGVTYHYVTNVISFEIIHNYEVVGAGRIRHRYIYDGVTLEN